VSEYQYYEFTAVDRPLDRNEQAELRSLSTRADITATRLVNTYEWGDFKGDPGQLMERYFDAHLYLANWGSRRLMLRLPNALLDIATATEYCVGDSASAWSAGGHVILDFRREDEYGDHEWDTDGQGLLASIIPTRADLAGGDVRLLYLAWLRCVQSAELDEDEPEPPVPAGLRSLSASLGAVADFLYIDPDLISAAAAASRPVTSTGPSAAHLQRWITSLPPAEKDVILGRLIAGGDTHLRSELIRRYHGEQPTPAPTTVPRAAGQLLAAAAQLRAERERVVADQQERQRIRREQSAAAARQRHLDDLAADEPGTWQHIDALIDTKRPREYDTAVQLLVDLRDLSDRDGHAPRFRQQLAELRAQHVRKPSLLERLEVVGLDG
jgi:hypothetical protein